MLELTADVFVTIVCIKEMLKNKCVLVERTKQVNIEVVKRSEEKKEARARYWLFV